MELGLTLLKVSAVLATLIMFVFMIAVMMDLHLDFSDEKVDQLADVVALGLFVWLTCIAFGGIMWLGGV